MHADRDPPAAVADEAHWGSLHDAWQAAVPGPAHGGDVRKEPLPAAVIIAIVEHRLGVRGPSGGPRGALAAPELAPNLHRRIASLRPHARDVQGRNWDIPAADDAACPGAAGEAEFRCVVDAVRLQFDIA